jgi:hypothetical protein
MRAVARRRTSSKGDLDLQPDARPRHDWRDCGLSQVRSWPNEHDTFSVDRRAYQGTYTHADRSHEPTYQENTAGTCKA